MLHTLMFTLLASSVSVNVTYINIHIISQQCFCDHIIASHGSKVQRCGLVIISCIDIATFSGGQKRDNVVHRLADDNDNI